jgi:hypothetical protein
MARDVNLTCDICGKPTAVIVGKLLFVPIIPSVARSAHSNYSHSADVGECCKNRLFNTVKFQKRRSFDEYQRSRRGRQVA